MCSVFLISYSQTTRSVSILCFPEECCKSPDGICNVVMFLNSCPNFLNSCPNFLNSCPNFLFKIPKFQFKVPKQKIKILHQNLEVLALPITFKKHLKMLGAIKTKSSHWSVLHTAKNAQPVLA